MYLDKQIDLLKKRFKPEDFKVPYSTGSQILKSIESVFIIRGRSREVRHSLPQRYRNWQALIKNRVEIRTVQLNHHGEWLGMLDSTTNYWMVLAHQYAPTYKHYVYDCKPAAILALQDVAADDFIIVEKKYRWFAYFEVDKPTNKAKIVRSGKEKTPFEG